MLIVCPNCTTSYQVEASSLGPAGRTVRCARCGNTWFAANPDAMTAIAQAHREDRVAFAPANLAAKRPGSESLPTATGSPPGEGDSPIVEAPPLAPKSPADQPLEAPPEEAPLRDDRGPAPRRDS